MGAAGLDREIPDLPHEIAHVHDVHFAEVAEVMFAHQQLRSLAHAVNVQIPDKMVCQCQRMQRGMTGLVPRGRWQKVYTPTRASTCPLKTTASFFWHWKRSLAQWPSKDVSHVYETLDGSAILMTRLDSPTCPVVYDLGDRAVSIGKSKGTRQQWDEIFTELFRLLKRWTAHFLNVVRVTVEKRCCPYVACKTTPYQNIRMYT